MKLLKNYKSRFLKFVFPQKKRPPFFTKDIFKDKNYQIGEYTYGNPDVIFENEKANLFIGKFCSIADNVTIFLGGNHRTDWITTYPFNEIGTFFPHANNVFGHPVTKGNVVIGNDVWIGRNVIILSGITIGNGAVIAAGSVVSKNIGDYEIWGGNPIKHIKNRFNNETIQKLLKLQWWLWDINKIKQNIETLCSENIENIQ